MSKRSRPKRMSGRKMHQVNFRVGEWEKSRLEELAESNGLTLTEYILASTVYADRVSGINPKVLNDIYEELNSQGVNLNQAMRLANSLHMGGNDRGAKGALHDIASMKQSLAKVQAEILNALRNAKPRRIFPEDVVDVVDSFDDDELDW